LITLIIDGGQYKAKQGDNILWTALDNGLYIPHLCAIRKAQNKSAACRLCLVEIEGKLSPVTACNEPVKDGMQIFLNTEKVNRLRKTVFELLLSHHRIDCDHCDKNGNCAMQDISAKLGLKLKLRRFRPIPRNLPVDNSHPLFYYDPNKCVLCGKCIWVCQTIGNGAIDFAFRGIKTAVSTFAGNPFIEVKCDSCLRCVNICPVGSLVAKKNVSH
jgi:bidirectional [NiFe] hydrogenase diaphorase subunit